MEIDVSLRVLVVEPDDDRFDQLSRALDAQTSLHVHVERVRTAREAHEVLPSGRVDVCFAPSKEGPDVSAALTLRLARAATFVPVVAVAENAAAGVEAIRYEGATDYILRGAITPATVERALWVAQARCEAVEAFRHEQELFSAALRNADLAVVELGVDGRVSRLSALAAEALGQEARSLLGRRFVHCFSEPQHESLSALLAGTETQTVLFREVNAGGEAEWVFTPLMRGGAVGIGRLLGREDADQGEAMQLLRHVADAIPMIVYATDADGHFTYVDGSALDQFGIAGADLVGESVFEIYGSRIDRIGYVRDALQGMPSDVQLDIRDRSFRTRYVPLMGADDRVAGMVMVAYDTTDLADSERGFSRLRYAIDAVKDAISLADVSGRAVHLNRALVELSGYTLDALNEAGGPPALFHDAAQAAEVFAALRGGEHWEGEIDLQTRTGTRRRLYLHADPVYTDEGELIGLVGVHRPLD